MIDTWKEVYTKSQRESLVEKTVASLKELVNVVKKEDLLRDLYIGRMKDNNEVSHILFISEKGELAEDAYTRKKIILKKDYKTIVEQYQLEPKTIEEIRKNIQNK